jgi:hypothetical protein
MGVSRDSYTDDSPVLLFHMSCLRIAKEYRQEVYEWILTPAIKLDDSRSFHVAPSQVILIYFVPEGDR